MKVLRKHNDEFYLLSLDDKPTTNDWVSHADKGILKSFNINDLDGTEPSLKITHTTESNRPSNIGLLNLSEIERLLTLEPEWKETWLVDYTKQNYLILL